jgi:hypothetical protein
MYLIRFIRTNNNKLIIYSDAEFAYTHIETSSFTGKSELVYKQLDKSNLNLYATNDTEYFEGKSQIVTLILYKDKNEKIQRSEEMKNGEDKEKHKLVNHISIYYGEEVCCTECNYYCNGSQTPINALAVMSVLFGLLLLIFSALWIIYSIVILCKKWNGPSVKKNDYEWENNEIASGGFNFNEERNGYMPQDSGRNVMPMKNLEESNDFQTNQFETDNVK